MDTKAKNNPNASEQKSRELRFFTCGYELYFSESNQIGLAFGVKNPRQIKPNHKTTTIQTMMPIYVGQLVYWEKKPVALILSLMLN